MCQNLGCPEIVSVRNNKWGKERKKEKSVFPAKIGFERKPRGNTRRKNCNSCSWVEAKERELFYPPVFGRPRLELFSAHT